MKEQLEAMKIAIQSKNGAMEECTDLLVIGDNVYTVGRTRDGFATWAVAVHDSSSHWGHYGLTTREAAIADMCKRSRMAE